MYPTPDTMQRSTHDLGCVQIAPSREIWNDELSIQLMAGLKQRRPCPGPQRCWLPTCRSATICSGTTPRARGSLARQTSGSKDPGCYLGGRRGGAASNPFEPAAQKAPPRSVWRRPKPFTSSGRAADEGTGAASHLAPHPHGLPPAGRG